MLDEHRNFPWFMSMLCVLSVIFIVVLSVTGHAEAMIELVKGELAADGQLAAAAAVVSLSSGLALGGLFARKMEQVHPTGVYDEGYAWVWVTFAIAWPAAVPLLLASFKMDTGSYWPRIDE